MVAAVGGLDAEEPLIPTGNVLEPDVLNLELWLAGFPFLPPSMMSLFKLLAEVANLYSVA